MPPGLLNDVRQLLESAKAVVTTPEQVGELVAARARLDGPLRVAIAGKVKAGKSTLLNALVGEQMAPTDAGECTRIVTWYCQSHRYLVEAHTSSGTSRELAYQLENGRLTIDLGGTGPEEIERLVVSWPSAKLHDLTLIDTPGLASLSSDVSARTLTFLGPDTATSGADAVVYLMRHLHEHDLRFLEAFRDQEPENRAAIHRLGVLSRADEIGGCTASSLDAAERVAP